MADDSVTTTTPLRFLSINGIPIIEDTRPGDPEADRIELLRTGCHDLELLLLEGPIDFDRDEQAGYLRTDFYALMACMIDRLNKDGERARNA